MPATAPRRQSPSSQDARELFHGNAGLLEHTGQSPDFEFPVERNNAANRSTTQDHMATFLPDANKPQLLQTTDCLIPRNPEQARRHGL